MRHAIVPLYYSYWEYRADVSIFSFISQTFYNHIYLTPESNVDLIIICYLIITQIYIQGNIDIIFVIKNISSVKWHILIIASLNSSDPQYRWIKKFTVSFLITKITSMLVDFKFPSKYFLYQPLENRRPLLNGQRSFSSQQMFNECVKITN